MQLTAIQRRELNALVYSLWMCCVFFYLYVYRYMCMYVMSH